MSADNIKRVEIKLPSSVVERLDIAARKKKWSRKKYVEEVLKDHVKVKKTVIVFGNDEIELK
jgi:metal-responsive CopG/Arc/MetJ family transcriptional regulator